MPEKTLEEGKFRFQSPKWSYAGGVLAVLVTLGVKGLIGGVYGVQHAIELIQSLQSSSLYFGSAIAGASATTLALMLTLLGFSSQMSDNFDDWVYRSINRICSVSALAMGGSVFLLLTLQLPVGEFQNLPNGWYTAIYYTLVTLIALLAGLMIAAVLMLLTTIRYVIALITPGAKV